MEDDATPPHSADMVPADAHGSHDERIDKENVEAGEDAREHEFDHQLEHQIEPDIDGQEDLQQVEEQDANTWLDQHEVQYLEQVEKRKKMLHSQLVDKTKVSASYYTTSKKEAMILQYVENFNRQYTQIFTSRKELILCPENEFGIKKFVCTTIRPTQLPFKEMYDYRSCAKFVADYLTYEPLDPPHELPSKLPSPTYTLTMQSGNCFDFSVLLVSLLRGFGYDAYVVSGYSNRDITILDETKTDSESVGIPSPVDISGSNTIIDNSSHGDKSGNAGQKPTVAGGGVNGGGGDGNGGGGGVGGGAQKYKVKGTRQLKSQFLLKQEGKRRDKEKKDIEQKRLDEEKRRAANFEDDDELKGLRVHAWVLVLPGKREVAESFFIEPSTGRIYSTDNENYLGVESLFSSTNYWVNMQVCYDGMKGIQFDLGDNSKWEFVLLDNTQPGISSKNAAENEEDNEEEENDDSSLEILDLPPSWVDRLQVTKEQYESKCPSGSKCVIYRNARVETFAEYHRQDGMISRNTFFADDIRAFNGEIREYFKNRRDKLRERIRIPDVDKIHEYFDPGRPHGLKEHVTIEGKTTEIHFYPSARSDGLFKRLETPYKIIEYFTEREDRMIYRSVTYEPSDNPYDDYLHDPAAIMKMTEKFDRNPDVPAHEDSAKQTYFLKEDKIRVISHLENGRIIQSYREFKKPNTDQKTGVFEMPNSFEVNPYLKPPKKQHLYAQLCSLIRAEQACAFAIKSSEREVSEILQARMTEEKDVALTTSIYDTIRNNIRLPNEDEKDLHKKEEEESKASDLDYLSPFLVNHQNSGNLSKEDAQTVKDACLKSLKERLIEKANIIQGKLEEITSEYQRRQLAYSRNADSMTVEETDEYVHFCNEAMFKIHILEKRLAKHKESAPDRYIQLDAKLTARLIN